MTRVVAGALPDEQRRGDCNECGWDCPNGIGACCFTWNSITPGYTDPGPIKTNYAYEALQGALAQAVIHHRRGRDPWSIAPDANPSHGALFRAFEWLQSTAHHPIGDSTNGTDDYWQTYVVNQVFLSAFPELPNGTAGKAVGYADWTTQYSAWP